MRPGDESFCLIVCAQCERVAYWLCLRLCVCEPRESWEFFLFLPFHALCVIIGITKMILTAESWGTHASECVWPLTAPISARLVGEDPLVQRSVIFRGLCNCFNRCLSVWEMNCCRFCSGLFVCFYWQQLSDLQQYFTHHIDINRAVEENEELALLLWWGKSVKLSFSHF